MTKGGAAGHPSAKHWVIDGRLRANPQAGSQFCLYFAIERGDKPNLSIAFVDYSISTELKMPNGKTIQKEMSGGKIPQVPCLINKHMIKKGTRLIGEEDRALLSVTAKMRESQAKKAKELKDAQKKKADGGGVAKPK